MTNKELQEYLKQFPDDAEIECIEINTRSWDMTYSYQPLNPEYIEFLDFRNDNYLPGKCFIRIGNDWN